MNRSLMMLMVGVCGAVGGYVPVLFGAGALSGWSLLGGFIGGLVGIWVGFILSDV